MSDKDSYGEICCVLSNIRFICVFARKTDFKLLKEMYEKLGATIDERRIDAEKEATARAEREEKRNELLQLIER